MRKLLVFTENYLPGGGNRYLIDMVNAVGAQFNSVVIVSNSGGIFPQDVRRLQNFTSFHEAPFITISRVNNYLRFLPAVIRRLLLLLFYPIEPALFLFNVLLLIRYIRRLQPSSILSCNGGYPAARATLAMVIAASFEKIPVALSIVSMPMPRKKIFYAYDQIMDRLVWKSADIVIVNAKIIAQTLHDLRDFPLEKAYVVHNGLKDNGLPIKNDVKSDKFIIGCVARMDRAKGVIYLFEAFIGLAEKYSQLGLVLAGKGDVTGELARRAEISGIKDRIALLGYYEGNIDSLLADFDVYVFPSLYEGFPYSVLEAMRAGCPIVATNAGGVSEAIRDGIDGILIAPGSVEALMDAIERLLLDKTTRQRLAINAYFLFKNNFTLEAMHARVREIFAVAGLSPPDSGRLR